MKTVRFLYLFAGPSRKTSLAEALRAHATGTTIDGKPFHTHVEEVDILQGGSEHDLLDGAIQLNVLAKLRDGHYQGVWASPPCSTWSRARGATPHGPQPLRSRKFPWGFPWLRRKQREEAEKANSLVTFSLAVLETVAAANRDGHHVQATVEHPEDLGNTGRHMPASIWQLPRLRLLIESGAFSTTALFMCAFGGPTRKPTRLVSNVASLVERGYQGPATFDTAGAYTGPLPTACGHDHPPRTMGTKASFREIAKAAAYPDGFNAAIAESFFAELGRSPAEPERVDTNVPDTVWHELRGRRIHVDDWDGEVAGHTYIGRGFSRRGLAPSMWGNPFPIARWGRAAAVDRFRRHLRANTKLLAALPQLDGQVLVCHCRAHEYCHGDVLLEAVGSLAARPADGNDDNDDDGEDDFDDEPDQENIEYDVPAAADEAYGAENTESNKVVTLTPAAGGHGHHRAGGPPRTADPGQSFSTTFDGKATKPGQRLTMEVDAPVKGGMGPPMRTTRRGVDQEIVDGGGLCSPGKWPVGRRWFSPSLPAVAARTVLRQALLDWSGRLRAKGGSIEDFVFRLALGRFADVPFEKEFLDEHRGRLKATLAQHGLDGETRAGDRPQAILVRLLAALARAVEDPDPHIAESVAVGVRTGILTDLPRTPAVFHEKTRWSLPDGSADAWAGERAMSNHSSAAERPETIRAQLEQEVAEGMILQTTVGDARRRWGDHLVIAALGAVPKNREQSEWRLVYDASHGVELNHRIRVRDAVPCPAWPDITRVMAELARDGQGKHFALAVDVAKAHRRIPIVEEEWGLLACRAVGASGPPKATDTLYVNTVGTFGVASAGYWWGRLAALLHRVGLALLGPELPLYGLLFSDDGLLVGVGPRYAESITAVLILWSLLDVPLSWKKTRGGLEVAWVGYVLCVQSFRVGFAASRLAWAADFCTRVAAGEPVLIKDVQEGLGRLSFVSGPLTWTRPFLGPVFAWVAACPAGARIRPPPLVRMVLRWYRRVLDDYPWRCNRVGCERAGELFRVDARADDEVAVIGGWVPGPTADTRTALWFSHKLSREDFPWAWSRGPPSRTIAALELLAVVFAVVLFVPALPDDIRVDGSVAISGATDNQGNEHVVRRWGAARPPLSLVAMELAYQLCVRNRRLDLVWRGRERNEEADALTNEDFAAFDPGLRVDASAVALRCLPGLWEASSAQAAPAKVPMNVKRKVILKKRLPLRIREPW